jgi:hypothetical protein
MAEQSHREEMGAAIRAQRERRAVPRSIATEATSASNPEPEPKAPPKKSLLGWLRGGKT